MKRAKSKRPPAPWIDTGWQVSSGRAIRFMLFLPGAKSAQVERQDDGSWTYRLNDSSQRFVEKTGAYVREEVGPFPTADDAAKAAEIAMAAQLRASLRKLKEIRPR